MYIVLKLSNISEKHYISLEIGSCEGFSQYAEWTRSYRPEDDIFERVIRVCEFSRIQQVLKDFINNGNKHNTQIYSDSSFPSERAIVISSPIHFREIFPALIDLGSIEHDQLCLDIEAFESIKDNFPTTEYSEKMSKPGLRFFGEYEKLYSEEYKKVAKKNKKFNSAMKDALSSPYDSSKVKTIKAVCNHIWRNPQDLLAKQIFEKLAVYRTYASQNNYSCQILLLFLPTVLSRLTESYLVSNVKEEDVSHAELITAFRKLDGQFNKPQDSEIKRAFSIL